MADDKFWFNKVGRASTATAPQGGTPNYGLTYDLATAPYDQPDQFDELAKAVAAIAAGTVSTIAPDLSFVNGSKDPTIWDHVKGAAGFAGNSLASLGGEALNVVRAPDSWGQYDQDWSWHGAGEDFKEDIGAAAKAPGLKQIFWGLEKANEYASTAFVAASLSEDDSSLFLKKGTWGDANALTKERHLNAGEGFVQMFYDKELILDEDRFEQMRQHNTVFNVGALAFNVTAAWKADPNVMFGKGLGSARNVYQGKLATNGRTAEVQREVLGAPDLDAAKAKAGEYSSLPDKLRASHAVSLYDRSDMLRGVAKEVSAKNYSFEQFKNLPAFKNSASGTTMAKLFVDVADDDDAWNLVFRSSIGDPDAVGELITRQGEVSDKIAAIEMRDLPATTADLERVETRYAKRLAEQGRPQDARIEIVRFGDKWLDDEVSALRTETDDLNAHLATYESHESWLQRALPGLDSDTNVVGRNAPNSVFNNLDRLGSSRSLRSNGGDVKMWQHDDYSPRAFAVRAPTKPFLKRVGVVSLNDVDEGGSAIAHYLDQMDHLQGGTNQDFRDSILGRFAGATTDMDRKQVALEVERGGISALGKKYGLSDSMMKRFAEILQQNRQKSWGDFTDTTMYSPIRGTQGREIERVDDSGSKVTLKLPVDVTQLSNYHSLTNLTDLDRTIRQNLDHLRDLDADLVGSLRAGASGVERWTSHAVDSIGTTFNAFWKPWALISVRWPMRVVADESMRVMLIAGVLPHLAKATQGAGNMVYNAGVVRPYEWWAGRKVKTGSLAEESLRGVRSDYDAYDYRAITNPTNAVPADSLDFGKIDGKRYDRLNAKTAERWQHLRAMDADRYRATTAPTQQPTWARQWDEKLNELETSDQRGAFFDPAHPHKGISKGFAVSQYPGRLRTFPRKPTAREMNYWVEKNSDVLSIPTNRAAVWLDKDTDRWHLDVVKTTARREDAMLAASKAEATEFYDIEDGFTRYLSEDFWGHFDSPFVKPTDPKTPGGTLFDQAQVPDEAGSAIGAAMATGSGPLRKKIGFGTKKWRTRDGRVVESEQVFGPDTQNPNVYHGAVSSTEAMQNLYGGHSRALSKERSARPGSDYKVFSPDDNQGTPDEWAQAYSYFVNNHVRYSPIWERMVQGQGDDDIYEWLMGSSKGRAARKRIGVRGENPAKWLDDERAIFDHLFPTERSIEAVKVGEVSPERALEMFPEGTRMTVNGDTIKMALGQSRWHQLTGNTVGWLMEHLGSMPTDAMVRHPFAATVYNREMRNYLRSVPADKVTQNVINAAEASARAKAVREVRRTLYSIADEREGVHMLRFVSPFFQAQLEVLERYARIIMEKPESLARIALLLQGSQQIQTGLWQVTDREGKQAKGYNGENMVTFQMTPTMRSIANKFLLGAPLRTHGEVTLPDGSKTLGDITIPVASLNLVLQGENPFLPSLGPLVTYPASEFRYKDRPELEDSAVYQWMFPFGVPKGDNFAERGFNTLAPAYFKRAVTAETEDFDDSAFARRTSEIGAQQLLEWELGGREGKRPTGEQALEAAKNEYRLRAASSFFLPAPLTPRSPYQFFIDQYRVYREKYGLEADEKFYDEYGPTYFMFAQQATESTGMSPDAGSKRAYDKYKSLATQAPMMTGVLTGPFATDEFSDAVYQWQLSTRASADSDKMLREHLSPAERIADAETSRGWVEYGKLASAIEAEVRNRVAAGGSAYITANSNADLAQIKSAKIREIIERNPSWQDAYNSRSADLGTFLGQAYDVSFDSKLDGRSDIEGLRTYLISRARLQDALRQREDSGMASSDQFSYDPLGNPVGDNADLAMAWKSYMAELTARNPLFAEIYTRYLEDDDLSTYISPEVSGAAA